MCLIIMILEISILDLGGKKKNHGRKKLILNELWVIF
jgi:hypothetical protein